jgi:UDP-N-acetylglucosamine--dolichyl-phosphate N-acetylglucosaminephosphotransferase
MAKLARSAVAANSAGAPEKKRSTVPRAAGKPRPPLPSAAVLASAVFGSAVIAFLLHEASVAGLMRRVATATTLSIVALGATVQLIPEIAPLFLRAGLGGKDINKRGTPGGETPVPESLGLVSSTVYLIVLCLMMSGGGGSGGAADGDARLYTAAMASVTFMVLLGFADDVLDLKWRYNLALPLVASMPLLVNYAGATTVVLPRLLRPPAAFIAKTVFRADGIVGGPGSRLVDIGAAYYVYMALLSIFCTNAINIYAGINGLEAGQSVVIAAFVLLHNALNLNPTTAKDNIDLLRAHHVFSIDLILPFAAVTLGLLRHNWYPSRVFVGDTFCYFAGMTFAMASILGHYSSTLLLFFIPQLLNFVYSLPQLFGIVSCPRHRLPHFNRTTGRLEAVKSHLNLVNLTLWITGPLTEQQLCALLLGFQAVCCTLGLALRAAALRYIAG